MSGSWQDGFILVGVLAIVCLGLYILIHFATRDNDNGKGD